LEQSPGAVLANLERIAKEKGIPTNSLRGSLAYNPAASAGIVDWRYLADLVEFAKEKFPHFKLVTVAIPPFVGGLAAGLKSGNLYLEKLISRGLSIVESAAAIQFSVSVNKSYFLEIARIRAFKLLWLNVLKAWGAPRNFPLVEARFQPEAYTDELYTNMIRATTMAMSVVLGGADRLTVLPYDAGREGQAIYPQQFSRRIARNVQQLLKMEGFFNEIPDAAAGSYYIEKLTRQLAERAWADFPR
jgi:methylmalonyl-CoA mutase